MRRADTVQVLLSRNCNWKERREREKRPLSLTGTLLCLLSGAVPTRAALYSQCRSGGGGKTTIAYH